MSLMVRLSGYRGWRRASGHEFPPHQIHAQVKGLKTVRTEQGHVAWFTEHDDRGPNASGCTDKRKSHFALEDASIIKS